MITTVTTAALRCALLPSERRGVPMDDFERFWQAYPRKVGKGAARKAFARALTLTTLETMLTALAWQRSQPAWVKDGGDYIPHPSTWLHQERWDDEPVAVPQVKERTARSLAAVEQWTKRA